MAKPSPALPGLPAFSPARLLTHLKASGGATAAGSLRLRLDMASGHSYTGRITGFDLKDDQPSLLFTLESIHPDAQELCYLYVQDIRQLTVLNASENVRLLRRDTGATRWSQDEALSALAWRRALDTGMTAMKTLGLDVTIDQALLESDGLARNTVRDIADEILAILKAWQSDDAGRKALSEIKAVSLLHEIGSAPHITRHEGTLTVAFDPATDLPDRDAFRTGFEKVF